MQTRIKYLVALIVLVAIGLSTTYYAATVMVTTYSAVHAEVIVVSTGFIIVYGIKDVSTPYYTVWNGVNWDADSADGTMGEKINWVVVRTSPTRPENVLGVQTNDKYIFANVWSGTSGWGTVQTFTTDLGKGNEKKRGFDIAYEQTSGDALFIYQSKEKMKIYYRIWDGISWSSENSYTLTTITEVPIWVEAASKPGSDEIAILLVDKDGKAAGVIWDGTAMGNEQLLETAVSKKDKECVAVAYEQSSGYAMFVWGASSSMESRQWSGVSWESEISAVSMGTHDLAWFTLKADPNSDKLVLVGTNDDSDTELYTVRWSGSAWSEAELHDEKVETKDARCADVIFETSPGHSGHIILVYGDRDQDIARYRHFDGSSWSSIAPIEGTAHSKDPRVVQLRGDETGFIFLAIEDDDKDLNTWIWNATTSTWTWQKEHTTELSTDKKYEPFMISPAMLVQAADKDDLYFCNNGTYAYFNETLAAPPDPSLFTYTVYLDKPADGTYSQDFRLAYSVGTAELQSWDGSSWNYVEDITVTVSGNSLMFRVSLSSIANPSIQEDTNVWFVEYYGANSYEYEVDRAPDTGSYTITYEVIPNLPGLTPLVFIPGVVATIYIIYKRRLKRNG